MELTELDKKVIDELGLSDASDQEKEIMLKTIDERLEKRFIAKLLTTLPEDKQKELEEKVDKMENPKPEEVVEQVVDIHPNAREILEESAREIIDELKQNSAPQTQPDETPVLAEPEETTKPEPPTESETLTEPVSEDGLTDQASQPPVSQTEENTPEQPAGMDTSTNPPASGNPAEMPASDKQDTQPQPDYYQSL